MVIGQEADRRFVEAVLWINRSGAQWRLLTANTGTGTASTNVARWTDQGGAQMLNIAATADLEYLIIDSTVVPTLARRSPKKGGQAAQALGRSRGGFSTKIHVSVDGLGNPLRFILTGGQQHDITQAEEDRRLCWRARLADQGYDAQEFRQHILELGMIPVIPPRSNRKAPADYDRHLYRERHLVNASSTRRSTIAGSSPGLRSWTPDTWASCTSPPLSSGGEMSTQPRLIGHSLDFDMGTSMDSGAEVNAHGVEMMESWHVTNRYIDDSSSSWTSTSNVTCTDGSYNASTDICTTSDDSDYRVRYVTVGNDTGWKTDYNP